MKQNTILKHKFKLNISLLLAFIFSSTCFADVMTKFCNKTNARKISSIPQPQTQLDLSKIVPFKPEPQITNQTIEKFVPTSFSDSKNTNEIGRQIMNRSLQSLTNGQLIPQPKIVESAKKIQKAVSTDVSIGSSEPGKTQHKVGFQVDAILGVAKLNYDGFFKSDVIYSATQQNVEFLIREQISDDATFSLNHATRDQRSSMNITWNW